MPGRPTFWIIVGQGLIALPVGAGGSLFGYFFSRLSLSPLSPYLGGGGGGSGGAKVQGKLPVPGRPTDLDYSRARAYCACGRWGWGLFGHFFSHLSLLFSFSLSLGDGPI